MQLLVSALLTFHVGWVESSRPTRMSSGGPRRLDPPYSPREGRSGRTPESEQGSEALLVPWSRRTRFKQFRCQADKSFARGDRGSASRSNVGPKSNSFRGI